MRSGKTVRIRLFMDKLREKNQTEEQRRRPTHAVTLYFEMRKQGERGKSQDIPSFGLDAQENEGVRAVRQPVDDPDLCDIFGW